MEFIKIEDILKLSEEELSKLKFHCTPISNIEGIDVEGLKPKIGSNSKGEFGNEMYPKVFFSEGLYYVLQMVNKTIRLVMYSIENRSNEKGQKGMKDLGIDKYKDEINRIFGNISKEKLEVENITPILRDAFFSIVKRYLEAGTYYILDLNGCTREEYEELNIEDKKKIDYLSDDYNYDINYPGEKVTANNMHTIIGQGVSVDKIHRIVNSDDSILNGFEIIMKLCRKYKEINPNKSFPVIINKDGSGDNWLEEFYQLFYKDIFESTKGLRDEQMSR